MLPCFKIQVHGPKLRARWIPLIKPLADHKLIPEAQIPLLSAEDEPPTMFALPYCEASLTLFVVQQLDSLPLAHQDVRPFYV